MLSKQGARKFGHGTQRRPLPSAAMHGKNGLEEEAVVVVVEELRLQFHLGDGSCSHLD